MKQKTDFRSAVGTVVELPLECLYLLRRVPWLESWHHFCSILLLMCLLGSSLGIQAHDSLSPSWVVRMEFLAPDFSLAQL